MPEIGSSGLMSGDGKRSVAERPKLPRHPRLYRHPAEPSHYAPTSPTQMLCEEAGVVEKSSGAKPPVIAALFSLNFFMADIQAGIGPFLGVFLLAHGWESGLIGTVMTIGGIAGMIMITPAGAMIDATTNKRTFVIIPGIFTVIASAVILVSQSFWVCCGIAGSDRDSRGRDRACGHGNNTGDRASGRFQHAERSQSGFQSRWQYGGRGPVWLPRMEIWFRRGVHFGGCVRGVVDHFSIDHP